MTPEAPIQCSRCSKPATAADARCKDCGGGLVRVCIDCGQKSSVAKRFCDHCGSRLRPDTIITSRRHTGAKPRLSDPYRGAFRPETPGAPMGTGHDPFRGPPSAEQAPSFAVKRSRAGERLLFFSLAALTIAMVCYAVFSGKFIRWGQP